LFGGSHLIINQFGVEGRAVKAEELGPLGMKFMVLIAASMRPFASCNHSLPL
jgi:hypothetical protein